jgi:uncharacterized protein
VRRIAIEEHFLSAALAELVDRSLPAAGPLDRLRDLGAGRIADMDAAGIDMQVLSPANAVPASDVSLGVARDTNDELAEAVAAHPTRFAGFATLPVSEPEQAAEELERCVRTLGFKGAMINGAPNGRFLDAAEFTAILERASALDVPIYIHPDLPPPAVMEAYYASDTVDTHVNAVLASAGWGWHAESGLHALRLMLSGTFDRFPTLQVIVGHMGEMVPFMLKRTENRVATLAAATPEPKRRLERTLTEYFTENFHINTSGVFTDAPLVAAIEVIGIERMHFGVDYPYSENHEGVTFLDIAPISVDARTRIGHANTERLLKIEPAEPLP